MIGLPGLDRDQTGGSMFFIVTGQGLNGPVAITCATTAAAVEKAHDLLADGVLDVIITNADDFQRLLPGTDA